MPLRRDIQWYEVDRNIRGLETDVEPQIAEHEIRVQRETIPLIFIPGIMGTRLRLAGTNGTGDGADGLPNMRWDPGSSSFMFWNYSGTSAEHRKDMIVGASFSSDFLEVANSDPIGDGFIGIMDDYRAFLRTLRGRDWGPLNKIFEFPVYASGYNWTDDNEHAGQLLAQRIQDIIQEAQSVTGLCEKVILITHSMGGLVARAASELAGARDSILGIIHGVQPATGAAAAYWRIKAGFEGFGMTSRVLGNSGPNVTAILGNIPGGLELLPTKRHRTNAGDRAWLTITENGRVTRALPNSNPYAEIYRVPAVVRPAHGQRPSTNTYWGLVDPALLTPGQTSAAQPSADASARDNDSLADASPVVRPWPQYLRMLAIAESFHDNLGAAAHPRTFCFHGTTHHTADVIELRIESNWVRNDPYPTRGFRGFFTNTGGHDMQAVLQDPAGGGDGTVPIFSASSLDDPGRPAPGDRAIPLEHQPAYEDATAQAYTIQAIIALAKMRYQDRRAQVGDFPTNGPGSNMA
jgi:pimeloyl-ACP methyl ester carboxylesterase